jgi:hypothetical protein
MSAGHLPQSSSSSRFTARRIGVLHLEPIGRAARTVGRVLPLRHDTFEPHLGGMGEDGRAISLDSSLNRMPGPALASTLASVALRTSSGSRRRSSKIRFSPLGFFTFPGATLPVTITKFDDVHILFGGSSKSWTISGSIDRITGDTAATSQMSTATGEITSAIEYSLKCRPAQRMF